MAICIIQKSNLQNGNYYRKSNRFHIGICEVVLKSNLMEDLEEYDDEGADEFEPIIYRQIGNGDDAYSVIVCRI